MHNKNWKKCEKNVKLYKLRIEQNVNTKKSRKINFTLYSLEYSISMGEDLNSHMPSPVLTYLFQNNLAKLCISANLFGLFWLTHIVNLCKKKKLLSNIDKL
jgi:hypothetical protein